MSIKVMTDVWAYGPGKQGELLVLLVLADFANDDGECWPAVETIAKKARIQERSARRILRLLAEFGYISVQENRGRNYTNLYQINLDALKPDNMSGGTFATVKPDICDRKTGHSVPLTIKNHQRTTNNGDLSFSQFWEAWPNKVAKVSAEAAWKKISTDDRRAAFDAIKPWFAAWRKRHPDAAPIHPGTYLNKRRWEDDAGSKTAAPPLDYYANLLNGDGFIPQNMISPSLADMLVSEGRVSRERIRERTGM